MLDARNSARMEQLHAHHQPYGRTYRLNHDPSTPALAVMADGIEQVISSWILFRPHRPSTPAQNIQDLLGDESWVRKARTCTEACSIETQIRKAAWRTALDA